MQTFREMVDKVLKDDINLNEDVYTSNFQLNKRIKEIHSLILSLYSIFQNCCQNRNFNNPQHAVMPFM